VPVTLTIYDEVSGFSCDPFVVRPAQARTDADGRFHFDGLADGTFSIVADESLSASERRAGGRVDGIVIRGGEACDDVELRAQPGAGLEIEVRDATGRTLLAQLMTGGSKRVIDGKPPFALVIGNAQHVRVIYEDQPFDLKPYIRVEVARFTLK